MPILGLIALASLLAAAPTAVPPECPPVAPVEGVIKFRAGERLSLKLDVYGADVGTFDIWLEPAPQAERGRAILLGRARARTSAFVSTNVATYEARVTALIGKGLLPLLWHEETEDGPVHWDHEATFPARAGKLPVKATRDGDPAPLELAAGPAARDMMSAFLVLRASRLVAGTPLCVDVFAGRRIWRMAGAVGPREIVDGPLGKREAVRLDLTSTRVDDPRQARSAKFWITDDARRLPLAAIAELRGKVIRAQLVEVK